MFNAMSGDQALTPITYYELSRLDAVNKYLTCPELTCQAPVYFYGTDAAEREVLGIRKPYADVVPSFHHYPGTGDGCPLHYKDRRPGTEEIYENVFAGSYDPTPAQPIQFDNHKLANTLAVWAHMFGRRNVSLPMIDQAIASASKKGWLNSRDVEDWRLPYVLARTMNFYTANKNELSLVRREIVELSHKDILRLNRREKKNGKDSALYVIYVNNRHLFSEPLELSECDVKGYARRNIRWAYEQLTPKLSLAV